MLFQGIKVALLDTNLEVNDMIRRSTFKPLPFPRHEMRLLHLVGCSHVDWACIGRLYGEESQEPRGESNHGFCLKERRPK